jgi:Flp pilus assembly protein CpaB
VIVAVRDLAPRQQITPADVRVAHLHPEAVAHDAVRTLREASGRWVVRDILQGEQITGSRTDLSLQGRPAYGLGPSYRAMFVPGGFSRLAGAVIMPGDRVDLVAVTAGRTDQIAYRLAVDLAVLAVRDERGGVYTAETGRALVGGILVAVPDRLVEPIALAIACGQVYAVMRDPAEMPSGGTD